MRTKTLLLTVAIGAVSAASSMAQVYSVNAVGYVNVTCNPGFNLIANPLVQADASLAALLPAPPDGTSYYKLVPAGFDLSTYTEGIGWEPNPATAIELGKGGYLLNPTASPMVITFVGDVAQNSNQGGSVVNAVGSAFTIQSSKVPQTGLITTDLGLTALDGDQLYTLANPGGFSLYSFTEGIGWEPTEPIINVGQSFFYNTATARNWTRSFNVN
jgi:hypothetical protein